MLPEVDEKQIANALQALYVLHGRAQYEGPDDILGVLVQTILSQQTTHQNSRRAFDTLIEQWAGDWGRIQQAPQAEVARAIDCAGLSRQKSTRIQALLARLQQTRGDYSLEFLRDFGADAARDYLTTFKGVGPKTAAFTLMDAAGMDVFPMDTHIFRICERLGWIEPGESSEAAHQKMERLIESGEHYAAHMALVRHGRKICHARAPECEKCPLRSICVYYKQQNS